MLAGFYRRCGAAAEVIEIGELPTPVPGPGEVLVRVRASGVNLVSLGRALVERRDTLLDTLGLHIDDEVGVANLRGVQ